MPRIYWIFRDIFIYRDGDRFVPIYAEALCGDTSRAVEAGGIKYWHPSQKPITPAEKEEILEALRLDAQKEKTTYDFNSRDQRQLSWNQNWDKFIQRQDQIEALPYRFILGSEWISTYQKGTLIVKIPIIKPVYQEDFNIVRFSPSTQWHMVPEGATANFDEVKKDVEEWSQVSGFAIEFTRDSLAMNNNSSCRLPVMPYGHDEVTGYLFKNYTHLFTQEERLAYRNIMFNFKSAAAASRRPSESWTSHVESRKSKLPEVLALLASGEASFYERVKNRILREKAQEVHFNRCPKCNMLCRTPLACLCPNPKCNHSWYEKRS